MNSFKTKEKTIRIIFIFYMLEINQIILHYLCLKFVKGKIAIKVGIIILIKMNRIHWHKYLNKQTLLQMGTNKERIK